MRIVKRILRAIYTYFHTPPTKRFRYGLISISFVLIFSMIFINVTYLAVTGKHLISGVDIRNSEFAATRDVKTETIKAKRGTIYSSDGEALTSNSNMYEVRFYLDKNRLANKIVKDEETGENKSIKVPAHVTSNTDYAKVLAPILNIEEAKLAELLSDERTNSEGNKIKEVTLGNYVSIATKTKIEALGLSGIGFTKKEARQYRYGSLAAHLIGYTADSDPGDGVNIEGQSGIEQVFEKELAGKDGILESYKDVNDLNLSTGIVNRVEAVDGNDVHLTIDSTLQRDVELTINELCKKDEVNYAWVLAMEAKTGKLLVMATAPSFDPNTKEFENHMNYNLQMPYECGSILKPFVYATAIDEGVYDRKATYLSGNFKTDGVIINDWHRPGWGAITFDEGLIRSSNVGICYLLNDYVSKEAILKTYKKLGLFEPLKMDGLDVYAGVNNSENTYVDYLMTGFGQSSSWTAFHMLRAYSVFANEGSIVEPYVVDYVQNPTTGEITYQGSTKKSEQIFSEEACDYLMGLMYEVVNDWDKGTMAQCKMDDFEIAGKSGTGQIYVEGKGYESDIFNYSYAIFSPAKDPEVIILCGIQGEEKCHHGEFTEMAKTLSKNAYHKVVGFENSDSTQTHDYVVPNFSNHTTAFASRLLTRNSIVPFIISNGTTIIGQYPEAGRYISSNSRILLLTDGTELRCPDFTGWSRMELSAYEALTNVKLNINGTGLAVSQDVEVNAVIQPDSTINITLK